MTCIIPKKIKATEEVLKKEGFSLADFHTKYNTTEKRVKFLTEQFNSESEAKFFNKKYENLLLSEQQDRMQKWATSVSEKGIDTDTRKTLLEKIDKLSKPLSSSDYNALDNESKQFLNGLVEQKLGFGLTDEELKSIISMNNNIKAHKEAILAKYPDFNEWGKTKEGMEKFKQELDKEIKAGKGVLLDYGLSVVKMKKVYDKAKLEADKQERLEAETKTGKKAKWLKEKIVTLAGLLKSTKASLDLSVARQLSSALLGHAGTWEAEGKAFQILGKYLKGELTEAERDTLEAMIYVRPNHVNGVYRKLGVAVGIQEEAYPESLAQDFFGKKKEKEKTGKGSKESSLAKWNPFSATEFAFTYPIQLARAIITDELYINAGADLGLLKEQGAGDYVNMITGRGKAIFSNDVQRYVNVMLFSPRWLSSRLQLLFDLKKVPYLFDKTGRHQIDRARGWAAVRQLVFLAMLPNLIMGLSRAYKDDKEWGDDDLERIWNSMTTWTSSDFGKFIVGDTRFDVSMGYASVLSNIAKMVRGYKTTISGVKREQGWGKTLGDFFNGKLSPVARTVVDAYTRATEGEKAKDFMYQPITWGSVIGRSFAPITVGEGIYDAIYQPTENKTAQIIGVAADFIGIGANTYGISEGDLGKSSEVLKAEKVLARKENRTPTALKPSSQSSIMKNLSGKTQERAVAEFERELNNRLTRFVKSSAYKHMTPKEQSEEMGKIREQVNKDIKKKYGLK